VRQRASEFFSLQRMAGNFDLYVTLVASTAAAIPRR
jgi:hypothetical protein